MASPEPFDAVACGQAPLRYNQHGCGTAYRLAVACGQAPLRYNDARRCAGCCSGCGLRTSAAQVQFHYHSLTCVSAVACGESSLRYTGCPRQTCVDSALWLAGNRRSDTLVRLASVSGFRLWLAGNRRSDTLTALSVPRVGVAVACGESSLRYTRSVGSPRGCRAVACGESSLRYTRQLHRAGAGCRCGLRGIVAQIHCSRQAPLPALRLWLAGNRRSDTLDAVQIV